MALRLRRGKQEAILQHEKRQEAHFSRDPDVAMNVSSHPGK